MQWVNATDLKQWADRRDCQSRLPELVRRLIRASATGISRLHIPSGDSIQTGGWDGILYCDTGNEFVPNGLSVWEFGVEKDAKRKAEQDFLKRTKNSNGIPIVQATFVFISPRTFSKARDWAETKKENHQWKNVCAYNADDLEAWLEQCHSVDSWLAQIMGKCTNGIKDAEYAWDVWACCPKSPNGKIHSALPIAGREIELKAVHDWLINKPSILNIQGSSSDEAYAFILAVLQLLPPDCKEDVLSRAIVVENIADFRSLIHERPLFFICHSFENEEACHAVKAGHHIALIYDANANLQNGLVLSRPQRQQFLNALQESGIDENEARILAKETDFNISNLHKIWMDSNILIQISPDNARLLAPLRLINKWDNETQADREAVEAIASIPYAEAESTLQCNVQTSEKVLDFADRKWRFSNSSNAWQTFIRYFTKSQINIFRGIVLNVFREINPDLELPAEKRNMASIYGKNKKYSELIREGLIETLIFMALTEKMVALKEPQQWVDCVVRDIFEGQNYELWYSLQRMMCCLAEASPTQFLNAVDDGLNHTPPVLAGLFEKAESSVGTPIGYYTDLLWALEGLARNPDYLLQITMILARLTNLHQPSNLCNSPWNSLRSIFCLGLPQTAATLNQRMAAIDKLMEKYPDVAWRLLLSIIPTEFGMLSPTHKFEWRKEFNLGNSPVTSIDFFNGILSILERCLKLVANDGNRWHELLQNYSRFGNPNDRQKIIDKLNQNLNDILNGRVELWGTIRSIIYRREKYSNDDDNEALHTDELITLKEIYAKLEPKEIIFKYQWMFENGWVEIPGTANDDYKIQTQAANEVKSQGVKNIIGTSGLNVVFELAKVVRSPEILGHTLASVITDEKIEQDVIRQLESENMNCVSMASGFIAIKAYNNSSWWQKHLSWLQKQTSNSIHISRFLTSLKQGLDTWDAVKTLSSEIQKEYWTTVFAHIFEPSCEELEFFVQKLIEYGRYYSALDIAALYDNIISVKTAVAVLQKAASATSDTASEKPFWDHYDISKLFQKIYREPTGDKIIIAHLEWAYLSVICGYGSKIQPKYLQAELAADPDFFVEVLTWLYRSRDEKNDQTEPEKAPDEILQKRATQAYHLLDSWRTMPGRQPDDSINVSLALQWINKAEDSSKRYGRWEVGCHHIGKMLANNCPLWQEKNPGGNSVLEILISPQICEIIEKIENKEIEQGFRQGIFNSRGIFWRSGKGGEQEREIAQQFINYAQTIDIKYPRVAKIMKAMASSYIHDAEREDSEADWHDIDGD